LTCLPTPVSRNLRDIEINRINKFVKGDIVDFAFVKELFASDNLTASSTWLPNRTSTVHWKIPPQFALTNVWYAEPASGSPINMKDNVQRETFYQISTERGIWILGSGRAFYGETPVDPQSPYSASKTMQRPFC